MQKKKEKKKGNVLVCDRIHFYLYELHMLQNVQLIQPYRKRLSDYLTDIGNIKTL